MNKEKLIRDLCARLPYDVKVLYDINNLIPIGLAIDATGLNIY